MASPIGHTLLGLTVVGLFDSKKQERLWRWVLFCVIAVLAADLDFIPGLMAGDVNRFHQGWSHSFLGAVLFGVFSGFWSRFLGASSYSVASKGTLLYSTHLFLDFFSLDKREPIGQPLFVPFSSEYFISPWSVFGGIRHGASGDSIRVFFDDLFSWGNLWSVGLEVVFLAPLFLWFWLKKGVPKEISVFRNRLEICKGRFKYGLKYFRKEKGGG